MCRWVSFVHMYVEKKMCACGVAFLVLQLPASRQPLQKLYDSSDRPSYTSRISLPPEVLFYLSFDFQSGRPGGICSGSLAREPTRVKVRNSILSGWVYRDFAVFRK